MPAVERALAVPELAGAVIVVRSQLVPALLAIILHEVSHGYVAEKFGDPTARLLGRHDLRSRLPVFHDHTQGRY